MTIWYYKKQIATASMVFSLAMTIRVDASRIHVVTITRADASRIHVVTITRADASRIHVVTITRSDASRIR